MAQNQTCIPVSVSKDLGGIDGLVSFDLGPQTHQSIGTFRVKGQFPRFYPKMERNNVSIKDKVVKMLHWAEKFFAENDSLSDKTVQLVNIGVTFGIYSFPFPSLDSKEMELACKFGFWLWKLDEDIEELQKSSCFRLIATETEQLASVVLQHPDTIHFKDVPGFPQFRGLFYSLADIVKDAIAISENFREQFENNAPLMKLFRWYFVKSMDGSVWQALDKVDCRYTERTFRSVKDALSYFDFIGIFYALLMGVKLTESMASNTMLRRMNDINNYIATTTNDVLGFSKELHNGETDNLLIFKAVEKKEPLEQIVKEICETLTQEMTDFYHIKQALFKRYDNDENLVLYVDIIESLTDGHLKLYNISERHKSAGRIKMTRDIVV